MILMTSMIIIVLIIKRSCLPNFDPDQLLECIRKLILLDKDWVPKSPNSSLYIRLQDYSQTKERKVLTFHFRPTMIGTEPTLGLGPANQATLFVILSPVGSYFGARHSVTLLCDPRYVRSASLVTITGIKSY